MYSISSWKKLWKIIFFIKKIQIFIFSTVFQFSNSNKKIIVDQFSKSLDQIKDHDVFYHLLAPFSTENSVFGVLIHWKSSIFMILMIFWDFWVFYHNFVDFDRKIRDNYKELEKCKISSKFIEAYLIHFTYSNYILMKFIFYVFFYRCTF